MLTEFEVCNYEYKGMEGKILNAQEVGLKIVQSRKKLGLTQRELAERLHVSDKAVSKWERGINYPDITLFDDIARELHISVVELLGVEENSKEEIVQGISEISKCEKEKICRALIRRGFLTIVCGLIVMLSQIYASFLFYQNGIYGLGLTCTSGMVGVTAILIANGIYSIIHAKKLYKNNSITNTTAQHATDT